MLIFSIKISKRLQVYILRQTFLSAGKNFIFDPDSVFTYSTIEIGDDVFISHNATLQASQSKIILGNKIMLGPGVTIIGGDHNTSVIGSFMFDVKEKRAGDDKVVSIEDDVWIGARATILKGVIIRRGCIVAAGTVVTKTTPPYTIVGGVPAKVLSVRFTLNEILLHEEKIYPVENRLSSTYLEEMLSQYWQKSEKT